LLEHLGEFVTHQFPTNVLLSSVVSSDTLIGITSTHKVSRHLTNCLVRSDITLDMIQIAFLGFDRLLQGTNLADQIGYIHHGRLLLQ
jgi:hypothetical protein